MRGRRISARLGDEARRRVGRYGVEYDASAARRAIGPLSSGFYLTGDIARGVSWSDTTIKEASPIRLATPCYEIPWFKVR